MISQELFDGLTNGLIWYPIVLAAAYRYVFTNHLDVSIDSVVILSAISSAYVWKLTASLVISFGIGACTGILPSYLSYLLITLLKVDVLISGILVTLACQSISVLAVGEALPVVGSPILQSELEGRSSVNPCNRAGGLQKHFRPE